MAKPKLDDVAEVAGVSPTTVSRVLNNRGYISQATRDKVHAAMHKINYRPNAIARSLQEQKTHLIGLVFPSVANPFYGELAHRIESKLSDAGYKVILCNSEDHPELEARYLEMLLGNQVDGVVTGAHSDVVANAPQLEAPLVTIDRVQTGSYPNICCDNFQGARLAAGALLERGAQNIVHFTSTLSEDNLRQQGFCAAVAEAGGRPRLVELGFTASADEHRRLINDYLDQHPEVDSVFASNDTYATMALQWARSRGKRVPEDFMVIGFDGTPAVRLLVPELATVVQPLEQIAQRAVERLLAAIDGGPEANSGGEQADILPVELHLGATVRKNSR